MTDTRKKNVLFLCTGNSARSQMAEAILRRCAGDRFEVHSAGLDPPGINPYTVRVLEEEGYDLSAHRSKSVAEFFGLLHHSHVLNIKGRSYRLRDLEQAVSLAS